MKYMVASFYKYDSIEDPEKFMRLVRSACNQRDILGRIFIGTEGVNGAVCGKVENVESFKARLQEILPGLVFKEQLAGSNAYHKLIIRVRLEIVTLGVEANLSNSGSHVTPDEFKGMLDRGEDVVLLDARNKEEVAVGKFENAIDLDIDLYNQFPKASEKISHLKDKKIVMYCTGGIRCEKSSAYLKEQGFSDVSQLKGGIIDYVNKFPEDHFKGAIYVFDDRITVPVSEPISNCKFCGKLTEKYVDCINLNCNGLFICCPKCEEIMESACSENCRHAPNKRTEKEPEPEVIGKVLHYYPKAEVAFVELADELSEGDTINLVGHTTKRFEQFISELRDEQRELISRAKDGMRITFPVSQKVRENDFVVR